MRPETAFLGLHGWRPQAGRLPYVAKAPTKDANFAILRTDNLKALRSSHRLALVETKIKYREECGSKNFLLWGKEYDEQFHRFVEKAALLGC